MIEIKALIVITLQLLLMIVNGGEVHDGTQWIQSKTINEVNGGGVSIDTSYNENTEIFISIASYRDSRCPKTIQTIFKTAKHPNRVKVFSHPFIYSLLLSSLSSSSITIIINYYHHQLLSLSSSLSSLSSLSPLSPLPLLSLLSSLSSSLMIIIN